MIRVIAETLPGLIPSSGVLEKTDFKLIGEGSEPGVKRFEHRRLRGELSPLRGNNEGGSMAATELELGAFSVSLAVKDLGASKAFYEALGFSQTGGDGDHYLIMVNGPAIVGLFHGMFEGNILTFNPGLGQNKEQLFEFTDVRDIRAPGGCGHRDDHRYGSGGHRPGPHRVLGPGREHRPDRSVLPAAGQ